MDAIARKKLREWFSKKPRPMTKAAFAKAIGTSAPYVTMLLSDNPPWPGRDIQRRIGEVTGGAVRPDDIAGYSPGE